MTTWLARGADGFRVDSLPTLLEDRLLRDEPRNPCYRAGVDSPHDAQLHDHRTQDVPPIHAVVSPPTLPHCIMPHCTIG